MKDLKVLHARRSALVRNIERWNDVLEIAEKDGDEIIADECKNRISHREHQLEELQGELKQLRHRGSKQCSPAIQR